MFFGRRVLLVALLTALSIPSLALRNEAVSFASGLDTALLEVFQVFPPPLSPTDRLGSTVCSFTLMEHVFSNSAGKPYIGISILIPHFHMAHASRYVQTALREGLGYCSPQSERHFLWPSI
jgi:hypothetical protein